MGRFLSKQDGVKCTTLTLDIDLNANRILDQAPAVVVALPCFWKRFYVPLVNASNWRLICNLVNEVDIIHLMSHWGVLNFLVYVAARRARKPYVICPAGSLPLFGRSGRLKRMYNLLAGRAIIRNAAAWIAVTSSEVLQFESYGIPSRKITVIPNGVSKADFPNTDKSEFLKRYKLPDVPIILFMGRLNPIKGPDLLLQAFIQARKDLVGCHLVFAGPDGGMFSELMQIAQQAGISDHVHFIGYLGGDDKSAAYHHAKLLVVPSRQEAMSIVALEAGICGTPAMVTDQCGFGEIREVDARLEVPATSSAIARGLVRLFTEPGLLDRKGLDFKAFVSRQYEWDSIVIHYIKLYRTILNPVSGSKLVQT
jgi:glycosyltransferase involved in cell wall biosynthesis